MKFNLSGFLEGVAAVQAGATAGRLAGLQEAQQRKQLKDHQAQQQQELEMRRLLADRQYEADQQQRRLAGLEKAFRLAKPEARYSILEKILRESGVDLGGFVNSMFKDKVPSPAPSPAQPGDAKGAPPGTAPPTPPANAPSAFLQHPALEARLLAEPFGLGGTTQAVPGEPRTLASGGPPPGSPRQWSLPQETRSQQSPPGTPPQWVLPQGRIPTAPLTLGDRLRAEIVGREDVAQDGRATRSVPSPAIPGLSGPLQQDLKDSGDAASQERQDRLKAAAQEKMANLNSEIRTALESGDLHAFRKLLEEQHAYLESQPREFGLIGFGGREMDLSDRRPVKRRTEPEVDPNLTKTAKFAPGSPGWIDTNAVGPFDRFVESPETDEEARARVLLASRSEVEKPALQRRLTREALGELLKVVKSPRWDQLGTAERASILDRVGTLSDELGFASVLPPGVGKDRLTPYEQNLIRDREAWRGDSARRNRELVAIRRAIGSQASRGELRPEDQEELNLMTGVLEKYLGEADALRRKHRDDLTEADRTRLKELTQPGGIIDREREAIRNLLVGRYETVGPRRPTAPDLRSSGGWNPALKEDRRLAEAFFTFLEGRRPKPEEARQIYALVETGELWR